MRYIVRTVSWSDERKENVAKLKLQLPSLEIYVDSEHDWYKTFFAVCRDIDKAGAILLEDDIKLCANFQEKIEAVIEEKGIDKVYSFFEKPKVWLPTKYVGGSSFLWMQCIYLPPSLPSKMEQHFVPFQIERPKRFYGLSVDSFISYVLTKEKIRYWRIRPCLVQHLDYQSTTRHAARRTTPYFIDDLIANNQVYDQLGEKRG